MRTLPRGRSVLVIALVAGCGNSSHNADGPTIDPSEAGPKCEAIGAIGQTTRRAGNPRIVAETPVFLDGQRDLTLGAPDAIRDGSTWRLYYHALHGTTPSVVTNAIRHATSTDRMTWTIDDEPLLGTTDARAPTVVHDGDRYVMMFGNLAKDAFSIAFSVDPTHFTSQGIVMHADPNETIQDPELAIVDGTYHLWYSLDSSTIHGVAHASSTDGMTWTIDQKPVLSLLQASADPMSGGSAPSVVYDVRRCQWEMWLWHGTAIFHADSTDAATWHVDYTRAPDLTPAPTEPGEQMSFDPRFDVGGDDHGRLVIYGGTDDQMRTTFGVATRDLP